MSYDLALLDLTNSNYWEVESFMTKNATPGNIPGSIYPIPEFEIPIFQRSRVMMASAYNADAPDRWYRGCYLKQVVGTAGSLSPSDYSELQTVIVPTSNNSITRTKLFFPSPAPIVWKLIAAVPWWHEQISLTLWRYTGELPDPISVKLQTIENKIDLLI